MNIYTMLPFLGTKEVDKYLDKVMSGEVKNVPLSVFLPFASQEKISEVFLKQWRDGNISSKKLSVFMPFVSESVLHELVVEYCQNGGAPLPSSIVPFLAKEDVTMLFEYKLSHPEENEAEESTDGMDMGFDVSQIMDMTQEITKSVMGGLGNMFGGKGKFGSVHVNVKHDNENEEVEDELDDAIGNIEDAIDDIECAVDDIDEMLDDKSDKKRKELAKKLEKLQRAQDIINKKLSKYTKTNEGEKEPK